MLLRWLMSNEVNDRDPVVVAASEACWCGNPAERRGLCGKHYWWSFVAFRAKDTS